MAGRFIRMDRKWHLVIVAFLNITSLINNLDSYAAPVTTETTVFTEKPKRKFIYEEEYSVDATPGGTVHLPCDVSTSTDDRVYMVLWFRQISTKPVYRCFDRDLAEEAMSSNTTSDYEHSCISERAMYITYMMTKNYTIRTNFTENFDARGRSFRDALHWSDNTTLAHRAYYNPSPRFSNLIIHDVQLDDIGTYRCRVDYKNSPTRNMNIHIRLVVPPFGIDLYDGMGKALSGAFGPINEGANVSIICIVRGGIPQPSIEWYVNESKVEYNARSNDGISLHTEIFYQTVNHTFDNTRVKCLAIVSKKIAPSSRSVIIKLNHIPKSLTIEVQHYTHNDKKAINAGTTVSLTCVCNGSKPAAIMTWEKNNIEIKINQTEKGPLKDLSINTMEEEFISRSVMRFKITTDDQGSMIRCIATNPLANATLETSVKLTVYYKPKVKIELGINLNVSYIKEGDDVYFDCFVRAQPQESWINFYKNDEIIPWKTKKSVNNMIVTSGSLVLRNVNRNHTGNYRCSAINIVGATISAPLLLTVQYLPECDQPSPLVIGSHLDQAVVTTCRFKSEYPQEVSIIWSFNNSDNYIKNLHAFPGIKGDRPHLVSTVRDYGILTCQAYNRIGESSKPCVVKLVPAGRARSPSNCRIIHPSRDDLYLSIRCNPGFKGGAFQMFSLEALTPNGRVELMSAPKPKEPIGPPPVSTKDLLLEKKRNLPLYFNNDVVWLNVSLKRVSELNSTDTLWVYVKNLQGEAPPYNLKANVRDVITFTDPIPASTDYTTWVAITAAAIIATIFIGASIFIVWFRKRNKHTSNMNAQPCESMNQLNENEASLSTCALIQPGPDSSAESEHQDQGPEFLESQPISSEETQPMSSEETPLRHQMRMELPKHPRVFLDIRRDVSYYGFSTLEEQPSSPPMKASFQSSRMAGACSSTSTLESSTSPPTGPMSTLLHSASTAVHLSSSSAYPMSTVMRPSSSVFNTVVRQRPRQVVTTKRYDPDRETIV